MIRFVPAFALSAALFVGFADVHPALAEKENEKAEKNEGNKEEKITIEQVPAKVRAAFEKEFPGAKIKKIEKETYPDGTVHYEFKFQDKDGKKHEIEYNEEGEQLEEHDE